MRKAQEQEENGNSSGLASVVERNIEALLERRRQEECRRSAQEKLADSITRFAGSMNFVYLHIVIVGAWVVLNLPHIGLLRFDPTFVILAMVASVEAIFLSTFVLITQNRMAAAADRRADLDLQISLLAEHEVTRLLELVQGIAKGMGVEAARKPELSELAKDVAPEELLDTMEAKEEQIEAREKGR